MLPSGPIPCSVLVLKTIMRMSYVFKHANITKIQSQILESYCFFNSKLVVFYKQLTIFVSYALNICQI